MSNLNHIYFFSKIKKYQLKIIPRLTDHIRFKSAEVKSARYSAFNRSIRHPTWTADVSGAIIPAIGSGVGAISNSLSESLITLPLIYPNIGESQGEVDRSEITLFRVYLVCYGLRRIIAGVD